MKIPKTLFELLEAADQAHDDMPSRWLCYLVVNLARELRVSIGIDSGEEKPTTPAEATVSDDLRALIAEVRRLNTAALGYEPSDRVVLHGYRDAAPALATACESLLHDRDVLKAHLVVAEREKQCLLEENRVSRERITELTSTLQVAREALQQYASADVLEMSKMRRNVAREALDRIDGGEA